MLWFHSLFTSSLLPLEEKSLMGEWGLQLDAVWLRVPIISACACICFTLNALMQFIYCGWLGAPLIGH